jgi:hypothetical protein
LGTRDDAFVISALQDVAVPENQALYEYLQESQYDRGGIRESVPLQCAKPSFQIAGETSASRGKAVKIPDPSTATESDFEPTKAPSSSHDRIHEGTQAASRIAAEEELYESVSSDGDSIHDSSAGGRDLGQTSEPYGHSSAPQDDPGGLVASSQSIKETPTIPESKVESDQDVTIKKSRSKQPDKKDDQLTSQSGVGPSPQRDHKRVTQIPFNSNGTMPLDFNDKDVVSRIEQRLRPVREATTTILGKRKFGGSEGYKSKGRRIHDDMQTADETPRMER